MRSKDEIEAAIKHLRELSAEAYHAGYMEDCVQITAVYDVLQWALGDDTAAFTEYLKTTETISRAKRQ